MRPPPKKVLAPSPQIIFPLQFVDEFEHWACMQSDHDQYHQYLRAGGLNRRMQFADSPTPPFEFVPPPLLNFFSIENDILRLFISKIFSYD